MPPLLNALALAAAATVASASRTLVAKPALSKCPVSSCSGGARTDANSSAAKKSGQEDSGPFEVGFKPGHFVCKSCDASACEGCALLCDLEQCSGEFFEQQCWCEEGSFQKQTHKVYCDEDCSGGICDNPRFRCRSSKDACQPWWWCGEPPPKWGPSGSVAGVQDFLQRRSQSRRGSARQRREGSLLSAGRRLASAATLRRAGAAVLSFSTGRFDCFSAALPPKVWDDQALMWMDRGYLVLDRRTCEGAVFDKNCFCWDKFKYLSGQDPLTSELKCDSHCHMGPCDGKTCSRRPPPPLPAPTAAPGSVEVQQIREGRLIMEPVDQPVLTGAGR